MTKVPPNRLVSPEDIRLLQYYPPPEKDCINGQASQVVGFMQCITNILYLRVLKKSHQNIKQVTTSHGPSVPTCQFGAFVGASNRSKID